ncbi:methylated-DNA--[protein]-cysteine S-methyltransferase [Streptomyces sp. NPDC048659]|uniref:methylated-DNA--[protein]-cysteine S-methyltransferase n=1 Tax=Streptomyces sp. NPDC048659 TaxID=3155489 RepID=UPI00342000C5
MRKPTDSDLPTADLPSADDIASGDEMTDSDMTDSDITDDEMNDDGVAALLSAASASAAEDADTLSRLHRRLERAAERADLIDVAYTTVDSPLGELLLAATPRGLVRVAYADEGHDRVLDTLGQKLSPRILRAPKRLEETAREIEEYFSGSRRAFDVTLDLSLSHGFRHLVQTHLPEIGYGETRSYRDMAELVGNPKAVRAVGTACATNPLPIVVPCHRVVRTDGTLGGYVGGLAAKTALLDLEARA